MREKSTGKVITYKFDPDKKTLVMTGGDGQEVKITASGDDKSGSVTLQSADGTVKLGAASGTAVPSWVPIYPDSAPENMSSAQTPQGDTNIFGFKTKDSPGKVISYYQDQLKSAGFSMTMVSSGEQGGMVQADNSSKQRSLIVSVSSSDEGTQARVVASEKK